MSFTDAECIAAAQSYIDGLVTHRADEVPFASDCVRIEMGLKTGRSGDHLRRSLNNGPQFKLIEEATPPKFTVDGDHVRAQFDVLTKPRLLGRQICSHVDETFLIPADEPSGRAQIHHINASIRPFLSR